jgi:hypothetical protein
LGRDCQKLTATDTRDLGRDVLTHSPDFVPLHGSGRAKLRGKFGRFAVQTGERRVWEIYFHALHEISLSNNLEMPSRDCYAGKLPPPSNYIGQMVSTAFFTVPTVGMKILFVFIVLEHDRRKVLHFNVTEHPTGAWTAQ